MTKITINCLYFIVLLSANLHFIALPFAIGFSLEQDNKKTEFFFEFLLHSACCVTF